MTVTTTAVDVAYTGNGAQTNYALPFYFTANTQIQVFVNGALLNSGYSLTGLGVGAGGTLVFDAAPVNGAAIFARRVLPLTQNVDPVNNATIFGSTLSRGLDFLTMAVQQISALAGRAVVAPVGEAGPLLPSAASRAGTLAVWTPDGSAFRTDRTLTAFDASVVSTLAAAVAAAASAALSAAQAALAQTARTGAETAEDGAQAAQTAAEAAAAAALATLANKANRNGDNTTSAFVGNLVYQFLAVGSQARTLYAKIAQDFGVNVRDFGGTDNGATDNTAAFQAAHDALPAQGGTIVFPCVSGNGYRINGTVNITKSVKFDIQGGNFNGAKFFAGSATGDCFNITGPGFKVDGIVFEAASGVVRTAGAYLNIKAPYASITGGNMFGHYVGIEIDGAALSVVRDVNFRNATGKSVSAGGGHIRIGKTNTTTAVVLHNVTADADVDPSNVNGQPTFGLDLYKTDAVVISDTDIIRSGRALWMNPPNGSGVAATYCANSYFDNSDIGIDIDPAAGGVVVRSWFVTTWASSAQQAGWRIGGTGGGNVLGTNLDGCQTQLCGDDGLKVFANAVDTSIDRHSSGQNAGDGVEIANGVDKVSINFSKLGAHDGLSGNTGYGIRIGTSVTNYDVVDNNLTGNTTGSMLDGSVNAASAKIRGNRGYRTRLGATTAVAGGTASVVIAHQMPVTPEAWMLNVRLAGDPANTLSMWAEDINATNFTVKFRPAPAGTVALNYNVNTERV